MVTGLRRSLGFSLFGQPARPSFRHEHAEDSTDQRPALDIVLYSSAVATVGCGPKFNLYVASEELRKKINSANITANTVNKGCLKS